MSASLRANSRRAELPHTFLPIREIIDEKGCRVGSMVNVIGVVVDFRAPVATRGKDWKCQMRLYDHTREDANRDNILFNVFRSEEEMPDVGVCDIVIIFQAKVIQRLNAESVSLITNYATDIHIYSANKIPKPPRDALEALKPSTKKKINRRPNAEENAYISSLYHSIDKLEAPTASEFEVMKIKSTNVHNKFKELKDIRDGVFADMIVQIVKRPYDLGDKYTIWVSDYTENDQLYNFAFGGNGSLESGGNPYGYPTTIGMSSETGPEWPGPYGKRSLQISCFEPHASLVRDKGLTAGDWVFLRNLQIKYGHNASNLEGYLREDRAAAGIKINIIPMDPMADTERIDPRLKEAIRRKRDYERQKKGQIKGLAEAAQAGKKRKSEMAETSEQANTKSKRRSKRAAQQAKRSRAQEVLLPDLNSQIKCEHQNKPTSSIRDMLEPVFHQTTIEGEGLKLELPFINANFRANVRVVNFWPPQLEDFTHPKKPIEYQVLTDHESDSDSDVDGVASKNKPPRQWEWRFYLQLEDATPMEGGDKGKKNTVWVAVDNQSAQCLVDLDATDLRNDPDSLEALRHRLFFLWGELEEHMIKKAKEKKRSAEGNGPPADSSDDESAGTKKAEFINRPFACCIRQYGVKVPESDPGQADAGEGKRWQRMFGLFGTRISS
ncbi:hypothetical protein PT974_06689 [Cladobotryum mycophilum]|uniref:Protection of telomeres protein 1 n=1 Tax=Cladobotryum mycophilum TaxID=491253 RepID=A0ABR0SND1_9HYPO